MITFTKPNSNTYAKIIESGTELFAVINQKSTVAGDSDVYLDGRFFKTEAGAKRWIAKQLA
jgi:hypothetical protein